MNFVQKFLTTFFRRTNHFFPRRGDGNFPITSHLGQGQLNISPNFPRICLLKTTVRNNKNSGVRTLLEGCGLVPPPPRGEGLKGGAPVETQMKTDTAPDFVYQDFITRVEVSQIFLISSLSTPNLRHIPQHRSAYPSPICPSTCAVSSFFAIIPVRVSLRLAD